MGQDLMKERMHLHKMLARQHLQRLSGAERERAGARRDKPKVVAILLQIEISSMSNRKCFCRF